jgi:hypothetical protein
VILITFKEVEHLIAFSSYLLRGVLNGGKTIMATKKISGKQTIARRKKTNIFDLIRLVGMH